MNLLAKIEVTKDQLEIPSGTLTEGNTKTILQLVFGTGGAIAVLIIVIAGLQFVVSQGDPQRTAKARNAIIYAMIGLAICVSAFSIVRYILGNV